MNKKGVFGLTAVQQFFAIILSIALLAYIIVVIMGTLSEANILDLTSVTVNNESGFINTTTYTLSASTVKGFSSPTITTIYNATSGLVIASGNYSVSSAGVLTNASAVEWGDVDIFYTYQKDADAQNRVENILGNTSDGITGFFSNINPVYAILAILVIILVLVVLVRVVQAPSRSSSVQL